jgi:transcriptional regulator with XRE-family HTH domain
MFNEIFSKRLQKARKNADLTQEKVSKELNVKRSTLAGWETGVSQPNLETLGKLARLYDVSLDWIIAKNTILI